MTNTEVFVSAHVMGLRTLPEIRRFFEFDTYGQSQPIPYKQSVLAHVQNMKKILWLVFAKNVVNINHNL